MSTSILCLAGATTTSEMAELSELYTRGCLDALGGRDTYDFTVLHRAPDGGWRLVRSLEPETLDAAPRLSFAQAVTAVTAHGFDLGLPQMFCHWGMTTGRSLFELLEIPFIGNDPVAMGLSADKALARAVVSAAGVSVPDGHIVRRGDRPTDLPALPVIVKPVASDNSEGLSLVERPEDLSAALQRAFAQGDALIEQFIAPGRELRCGVIEREGELFCLPPEEYPVDPAHPIRTKTDKLARPDGILELAAKTRDAAWIVAPDDPVIPALHAASRKAYRALNCRHYGLFDFRVSDDGTVWFLEAGLYCSFSAQSVIAVMAEAAHIPLPDLFSRFVADVRREPHPHISAA